MQLLKSQIVFDDAIYPRGQFDAEWVRRLKQARAAGDSLPPVEVWKSANGYVLVDGKHRLEAEPAEEVTVKVLRFESALEAMLYAVRVNARHGKPLSPYDVTVCIARLTDLACEEDAIQEALALTAERFDKIVTERMATLRGHRQALKRSVRHLAGTELPDDFDRVHCRLQGMPPAYFCEQLILLLEGDLIDETHEKTNEALNRLFQVLSHYLNRRAERGTP